MNSNDACVIMNAATRATNDLYYARFSSCPNDRNAHWHDVMHQLLIITEQCRQAIKRIDQDQEADHAE